MNNFEQLQAKVYGWAEDKDLLKKENSMAQFGKVQEEIYEVLAELEDDNMNNLKTEIGDVLFSIMVLAFQNGLHPVDCLRSAWEKNEHREGVTIDGQFIRDKNGVN